MSITIATGIITPTSELDAINVMLSGIGEAPVNSLTELTSDVAVARNILLETSKELQLEGFAWNTEDDYPLSPDVKGDIKLHPSIIRIHFREPTDRELVVRGSQVYDRTNHTFTFPPEIKVTCTITQLLPFEQIPEAARRYVAIRALRIFQERVVGSQVLSTYQLRDEARARALLMADERRTDRPNIIMGTFPPISTWQVRDAVLQRRRRRHRP